MIKYQHFALDNLFLVNGYREMHTGYGIEREYDREDELEQCIRRLVLRKSAPLRGWDLRFLRRGLEISQTDFGKMVDRDAQTVARWEKSAENVPKFVDMMIRARFAERFEPQIKLAELLSYSDGTAPALPTSIQLTLTQNGWVFDFGLRTVLPLIKALSISSAALPAGHGLVQTVSKKMYYVNTGKVQYLPSDSKQALQATTSVEVPTRLPKHITQGFYHEQKQHYPN